MLKFKKFMLNYVLAVPLFILLFLPYVFFTFTTIIGTNIEKGSYYMTDKLEKILKKIDNWRRNIINNQLQTKERGE